MSPAGRTLDLRKVNFNSKKYLPKSAAGSEIFLYLDVPGRAISAPHKFLRDIRYIPVILRAALRVTAELNEMVQ
jgi:hypothetical protein